MSQTAACAGAHTDEVDEIQAMLERVGAFGGGFAAVQYDLNSTWRRLPSGTEVNAHLCDHNCTIVVRGEPTGGNYICPASLSLNHGVSRKWLAPAEVILRSIDALERGAETARGAFFAEKFAAYCAHFQIPADVSEAIRRSLDRPGLEVNLFGGNPEMHPEVDKIIGELRDRGHRVHFTTTGRRLMRDAAFVERLLEVQPHLIALSADDFDSPEQIRRLAGLSVEELKREWKSIRWEHGQRQKAYEAIYVANLSRRVPAFPRILFNMVIHPGNVRSVEAIVDVLSDEYPRVLVNPFPAQSAFLNDGGEQALGADEAYVLRDLIDWMIKMQADVIRDPRSAIPVVNRLHYWLMLRSVFDLFGEDGEGAARMIVGDGIWRCYQDPAAGRYLQVGMGAKSQEKQGEDQHPGGYLGCFWNNETVTFGERQTWTMADSTVDNYLQVGKQALGNASARPCPGCAFPRLTYDMLATESGMNAALVPFYLSRRADVLGF